MSSRTRQSRPPPVKAPPAPVTLPTVARSPTLPNIEPTPPLHHFTSKHETKPDPPPKDLPPTPIEPPAAIPEVAVAPQGQSACRASSVYSRPETNWEKPAWWDLPEDEEAGRDTENGAFLLPPTIYHDARTEASRKLEGIESPARTYSPIIPEPSPSLTPPFNDSVSHTSSQHRFDSLWSTHSSIPEDFDRAWAPLPPTPPSPPHVTYPLPGHIRLASSPPGTPNEEQSMQVLRPLSRGLLTERSWYEGGEEDVDDGSSHGAARSLGATQQSTDSLPRGRGRLRNLPSYFHREQNYLHNPTDRVPQLPATATLKVLDTEPRSLTSDNAASNHSLGMAKSDAVDLLEQRKAKTLSEAYHTLLIEQYQDLAAEGRAWEAFTDASEVAAIDEEADGRDIKLVPEPLFFPERGRPRPNHTSVSYVGQHSGLVRKESKRTTSPQKKGGLSVLKGILPGKLKRADSLTSGDIPISPPPEMYTSPAMTSHGEAITRMKPWSRKKASTEHVPPLPLTLPKSVASSSRPSSNLSPAAASRRDGIHTPASSTHHKSPHTYSGSEEVYPRPMDRVPRTNRPPEPARSKTYDVPRPTTYNGPHAYHTPTLSQTPPDSAGSGKASWNLLDRVTSKQRRPFKTDDSNRGGSTGRWYGRARDSIRTADKVKRQHDLKKSIKFVGQVDPRHVETLDDTNSGVVFTSNLGRRPTLGEG